MNSTFQEIAPYLKDPLVLIGFFLFVALLITRTLLTQKLLKPLPPTLGYQILRSILLYGFIIGLLVIILGFALKYQEIAEQQKTVASLEKMLGEALQSATGMADERKKEIIEQFLAAYRSGAMSKEQIEQKVGTIKISSIYSVSNTTEPAPIQHQSPATPPDNTKVEAKTESSLSPTPNNGVQPAVDLKIPAPVETRVDNQPTKNTDAKVEGVNKGMIILSSEPSLEAPGRRSCPKTSHSSMSSDAPRIEILQAMPAGIEKKPQIFNVCGRVTLPSGVKSEDIAIVIYTRSGGGDNIQLQMLGTQTREPRIADWTSNNEWEVEIWLGTEIKQESFYWVYAVAIQNFKTADSKRLIALTHNKYTNFKDEILDVLLQGNFRPLAWAQKRTQRDAVRYSSDIGRDFDIAVITVNEAEHAKLHFALSSCLASSSALFTPGRKCRPAIPCPLTPARLVGSAGFIRVRGKCPPV